MGKLRIAIVGCGGIANQKHMPSIKTVRYLLLQQIQELKINQI